MLLVDRCYTEEEELQKRRPSMYMFQLVAVSPRRPRLCNKHGDTSLINIEHIYSKKLLYNRIQTQIKFGGSGGTRPSAKLWWGWVNTFT